MAKKNAKVDNAVGVIMANVNSQLELLSSDADKEEFVDGVFDKLEELIAQRPETEDDDDDDDDDEDDDESDEDDEEGDED